MWNKGRQLRRSPASSSRAVTFPMCRYGPPHTRNLPPPRAPTTTSLCRVRPQAQPSSLSLLSYLFTQLCGKTTDLPLLLPCPPSAQQSSSTGQREQAQPKGRELWCTPTPTACLWKQNRAAQGVLRWDQRRWLVSTTLPLCSKVAVGPEQLKMVVLTRVHLPEMCQKSSTV